MNVASPRSQTQEAVWAIFLCFFFPFLGYAAHLGAVVKYLFPLCTLLLAGILYARCSPWYLGLIVMIFASTPMVRRLVDEQTAWDPSNPVLLSPYLACCFCVLDFGRLFTSKRPRVTAPYIVVICCVGYGLILAVIDERLLSGLVDAMKWSAGPLVAIYTLSNPSLVDRNHKVITSVLTFVALFASVYGIAQYVQPFSWDAEWVKNVQDLGLDSIGVALPFSLRVFGTMNSPGSLAALISAGILVTLNRRLVLALPIIGIMILCLLLTLYRAVWAGTLIGLLYIMMVASAKVRLRLGLALAVSCLIMTSSLLLPQLTEGISDRISGLNHLSSDASGASREHQYEAFLGSDVSDIIVGQGLATNGASRRLDGKSGAFIDGGFLEIFSSLGLFIGTLLLAGVAGAVAISFSGRVGATSEMVLYRAVALSLVFQLPFGNVLVAESGFFGWLLLGLAAARVELSTPTSMCERWQARMPLLRASSRIV